MIKSTTVVWDIPTRLLHWSLAVIVFLNLFILDEGDEIHEWIGYLACALVIFRVYWGERSQGLSRISSFPIKLKDLKRFIKNRFTDSEGRYPGHNPLASVVYIAIWTCILLLGITGFMMGLDAFWGEDWLEKLHELISDTLLFLIVIHLTGVFSDSIRNRRKTWSSMITGKK